MALPDNGVAWELQKQLARSGASVGANLAERKGVLSKPFSPRAVLQLVKGTLAEAARQQPGGPATDVEADTAEDTESEAA